MRKHLLVALLLVIGASLSAQEIIFNVKTPPGVAGGYEFTLAEVANGWEAMPDMTLPENAVEAQLVIVSDGTASDSLGCNPLVNGGALAGKIAVVYRGSCSFGEKTKKAMDAGAIGVIVVNHSPGLVNMLAGDSGAVVGIPSIFVENVTGAILYDAIRSGTCTAYIGVKPVFPVDLGSTKQWSIWPNIAALPRALIGDFNFTPGLWVKNNGSTSQSGATASIIINNGSTDVYSNSAPVSTLNPGDSVFVSFPAYTPASTAAAYTATYAITTSGNDEFSQDNVISGTFAVTNEILAYTPIDFATERTDPNAFYRYNDPTTEKFCLAFRSSNATNIKVKGLSFAMTANTGVPLTDKFVHVGFYQWDDSFTDLDSPPTYDALNQITGGDYVFPDDIREIPVLVPFDESPTLVNDQRYLACVEIQFPEAYFGSNTNVNLWETTVRFNQPITPAQDGTLAWFDLGFGLDNVLAIGLHTEPSGNGINSSSADNVVPAYPIPAKSVVNIPLAAIDAKSAEISVMDVTGKEVMVLSGKMESARILAVNTTALSNGSYVFNVKFDNGKTAHYRVVVAH